jgi:hypothetical protein
MGLLNFWKKKGLDQPVAPSLDYPILNSDLPSLDGSSIDVSMFDASNLPKLDNLQTLPSPEDHDSTTYQNINQNANTNINQNVNQNNNKKTISFNIPTMDFSLPSIEDEQDAGGSSPKDNLKSTDTTTKLGSVTADNANTDSEYADLNKLFITDEDWKEPDWKTFDPYTEVRIEKPTQQDFKGADLPQFKDITTTLIPKYTDGAVSEPDEPFKKQSRSEVNPLEIFVRGNAYGGVFTELEQMNKSLAEIDSQMNSYEEMLKKEEPLLLTGKEEMEYLYRRLTQIDKKIFIQ